MGGCLGMGGWRGFGVGLMEPPAEVTWTPVTFFPRQVPEQNTNPYESGRVSGRWGLCWWRWGAPQWMAGVSGEVGGGSEGDRASQVAEAEWRLNEGPQCAGRNLVKV